MSLDDTFIVAETTEWAVEVDRHMPLRYADVQVRPKAGYGFSMNLYFKCDTRDLGQYDSREKVERSVRMSSEKYLGGAVENSVKLRPLDVNGWYGCYTVLTDASLAGKTKVGAGEFK